QSVALAHRNAAGSLTPYAPVNLKTVSDGFCSGISFSSAGVYVINCQLFLAVTCRKPGSSFFKSIVAIALTLFLLSFSSDSVSSINCTIYSVDVTRLQPITNTMDFGR